MLAANRGAWESQETRSTTWTSRLLRTPKAQLFAVFAVLLVISAPLEGTSVAVNHVVLAVLTACLVELPFLYRETHRWQVPSSALLTGLIVAFLLDTQTVPLVTVWTSAVAVLAKHVVSTSRGHIFNPAALSLLFTAVAFGSAESWWGGLANVSGLWLPVLLLAGAFIAERLNKFPLVLAFAGAYFGIFGVVAFMQPATAAEMYRSPFLQSALFLAFFMLTDPPTSPNRYGEQVAFGIISASVAAAAQLLGAGQVFLLAGVLAANGWLFLHRSQAQTHARRTQGQGPEGSLVRPANERARAPAASRYKGRPVGRYPAVAVRP